MEPTNDVERDEPDPTGDDDWEVDMPRRNPLDYILEERATVLGS